MMDGDQIDALISLLRDRPALWRKEDVNFCNREVRRKLTEEVSAATGFPASAVTKKIKALKDRMRICVSKLPKTKNGTPAFAKGSTYLTWPHYNEMLFMKDQFLRKSVSGSYTDSDSFEPDEEDPDTIDRIPEVAVETLSPVGLGLSSEYDVISIEKRHSNAKRPRSPSPVIKEEFVELEKLNTGTVNSVCSGIDNTGNMTKLPDPESKKDDLHFFMADIVNDMRMVTDPYLKIQTKAKIRRVVEEAVMTQIELNRSVTMSSA